MSGLNFPYTCTRTNTLQGEQIDALLEAGVSKWPQMEGRFPQVGRITFNFDGKAEPGQRIHDDSIQIGGVPVEKGKVNFCDPLSLTISNISKSSTSAAKSNTSIIDNGMQVECL